jgi:hypothetical protein
MASSMKTHLSSPVSSFFFSEFRVKHRADVGRRASRLPLGHHWLPFSATLLWPITPPLGSIWASSWACWMPFLPSIIATPGETEVGSAGAQPTKG